MRVGSTEFISGNEELHNLQAILESSNGPHFHSRVVQANHVCRQCLQSHNVRLSLLAFVFAARRLWIVRYSPCGLGVPWHRGSQALRKIPKSHLLSPSLPTPWHFRVQVDTPSLLLQLANFHIETIARVKEFMFLCSNKHYLATLGLR